jgi:hypothetical protein
LAHLLFLKFQMAEAQAGNSPPSFFAGGAP